MSTPAPPDAPAAPAPPPPRPRASAPMLVLATLAVGYTLWAAQDLLLPVLLAMFFALVGNPIIRVLRRLYVPRFLGALIVLLGGMAVTGLLAGLAGGSARLRTGTRMARARSATAPRRAFFSIRFSRVRLGRILLGFKEVPLTRAFDRGGRQMPASASGLRPADAVSSRGTAAGMLMLVEVIDSSMPVSAP